MKTRCSAGYVINPYTKRCIYKSGNTARKIFSIRKKRSHKRDGRPSPNISALLFSVGTVKRGHDGKLWKIKKNRKSQRWVRNCSLNF